MALRSSSWYSLVVIMMVVVVMMMVMMVVEGNSTPSDNLRALAGQQVWESEDPSAKSAVVGLEREGLTDILSHSSAKLRFRVFKESHTRVSDTLLKAGVKYQVLIPDLERHHKASSRLEGTGTTNTILRQSCTSNSCPRPKKNNYMTFEEIEWYLKDLATRFERVEVKSIGKSHEGRDIWMVHIKAATEGEGKKKAIWLEGGLHAREWISPAVSVNLINKMARKTKYLPVGVDIFAVPMANPDGYVYSWTTDRYWRKNRRENNINRCPGVDLNRNWDEHFGLGASTNPCSEVYMGPSPFSEPETKAMKEEMTAVAETYDLRLVMALHSYGQVLLYPWGWGYSEDKDALVEYGNAFANAAKKPYGNVYGVVNSGAGFYEASGTTDDWAKGQLDIKFSYTLELPDKGQHGFTLPASRIRKTAKEVIAGMKKLIYMVVKD